MYDAAIENTTANDSALNKDRDTPKRNITGEKTIMVVTVEAARANGERVDAFAARGVECVVFETRDLSAVTAWLAARDVLSLLVEGGPRLQEAFFEAGLVDRIVTPQARGGGVAVWDAARYGCGPTTPVRSTPLGDDLLMECDVHGTH